MDGGRDYMFEDRNRSIPRTETPSTSRGSSRFRGRGRMKLGVRGKSCARARAFNKVLRFFSRGKLVYGSSRMSNGCRGIACRFTHQANFPAYRGAIFLPSSPPRRRERIIALLLFHSFPSREFFIPFVFPLHQLSASRMKARFLART